MLRFSRYAENKFEILNSLSFYTTREEIESVFTSPDKHKKQGSYYRYQKDNLAILVKKRGEISTIITFFPIGQK